MKDLCGGEHGSSEEDECPILPAHVIAHNVSPFLDRQTFNAVRLACREVHQYLDLMDRAWPRIKLRLGDTSRQKLGVQSLAFNKSGRLLACRGRRGSIQVWDRHSGKHTQWNGKGSCCFGNVVFSPFDENVLACDGNGKCILLNDVSTGRCLQSLRGHHGSISSICFSPTNSNLLASSSTDSTINLWDKSKPVGQEIQAVLNGHRGAVYSLGFSPDGRLLASGGMDRILRVWKLQKVMQNDHVGFCDDLHGHEMAIVAVNFSSNNTVLSSSLDMKLRIWSRNVRGSMFPEGTSMVCTRILNLHNEALAMELSTKRKTVAVGLSNDTIAIWNLDNDTNEVHHVQTLPGRLISFGPDVMVTSLKQKQIQFHDAPKQK